MCTHTIKLTLLYYAFYCLHLKRYSDDLHIFCKTLSIVSCSTVRTVLLPMKCCDCPTCSMAQLIRNFFVRPFPLCMLVLTVNGTCLHIHLINGTLRNTTQSYCSNSRISSSILQNLCAYFLWLCMKCVMKWDLL